MTNEIKELAAELAEAREVRDIQQARNHRQTMLDLYRTGNAEARSAGRADWARASVTEEIASQRLQSAVHAETPTIREQFELLRSIAARLERIVALMEARDAG